MRQRLWRRIRIRHYIGHDPEIRTMVLNFTMALRPRFSGDGDKRLSIEILRRDSRFEGQPMTCWDTGYQWLLVDRADKQLR